MTDIVSETAPKRFVIPNRDDMALVLTSELIALASDAGWRRMG